jgi:REP element-mobilizing transposase RayT
MSYTNLTYHIVFSTKERRPFLIPDVLPRACEYMGGIIRNLKGIALAVNGTADHVHIAAKTKPTIALADFVPAVKSNCSGWIHDTFPDLRAFQWQEGYSAFSVSQSVKDSVVEYVMKQEQHHRKRTFQEELIELLKRHEVEYNEKHIWD